MKGKAEYEREKYYRRKYKNQSQNEICLENRCFGINCCMFQFCRSEKKRDWRHRGGKLSK